MPEFQGPKGHDIKAFPYLTPGGFEAYAGFLFHCYSRPYLIGLLDVPAVIQVSGDSGGAEGVATTGFGEIDG
jgi:hypothetical protein